MTTAADFWDDAPYAWARVEIHDSNGTRYGLPGIAVVDVDDTYGLDIRVTPLAEGARYIPTGNQPQPVKIGLTMWTQEQWIAWTAILGMIKPPAKRQVKPKAFGCYHPVLAAHGISSMIFKHIGSPRVGVPGGPRLIDIECVEYKPLKPIKPVDIKSDTRDTSLTTPLLGSSAAAPPSGGTVGPSGPK